MKPLHKAWRAWLLTDTPASRRQAALGLGYRRWRRFASNPLSVFGLVILILMIVFAAIGPLLPLHDPLRQVLSDRLLPPGSPSHWFGTDQLGRDILAARNRLAPDVEHRDPGRGAGRAGGFADRNNGGLLRRFRRYGPDAADRYRTRVPEDRACACVRGGARAGRDQCGDRDLDHRVAAVRAAGAR